MVVRFLCEVETPTMPRPAPPDRPFFSPALDIVFRALFSMNEPLLRWARFLLAKDEEELHDLAAEDPTMAEAARKHQTLTNSVEFISLAKRAEDAWKWQEISRVMGERQAEARGHAMGHAQGLAEGRAEGVTEGVAEGRAEGVAEGRVLALFDILAARFGEPSEAIRQRIIRGTADELREWLLASVRVGRAEERTADPRPCGGHARVEAGPRPR
jgi:hypothetical protein